MSSSQNKVQELAVIEVKGVAKCYHSYNKPIHRLLQSFTPNKKMYDEFWALKSVDLTVHKGETVGIVGKNGSGKSTLLQIVTGILQPTQGRCKTVGRISALLELGAGFNPDFTGMENARLNASIMGLSREEFHKKLPDIVEFCGLGDFLHRPVKTYSSGMFVRLAFAVAINMDPDILIIDEALAVGDVRFQSRCFRRLDELKAKGVSILFVTHSTESVIKYCDRAILLDDGELKLTSTPKAVVQEYLEMMFGPDIKQTKVSAVMPKAITSNIAHFDFDPSQDNCIAQPTYNPNEHRWGDQRATICQYELLQNGKPSNGLFQSGEQCVVRISIMFNEAVDDLIYGLTVKTSDGKSLYGINSRLIGNVPEQQVAGELVTIEFTLQLNLLAGDYFISLGVAQDHDVKDNVAVDRRYDMIHIHVRTELQTFGIAQLNGDIRLAQDDAVEISSLDAESDDV